MTWQLPVVPVLWTLSCGHTVPGEGAQARRCFLWVWSGRDGAWAGLFQWAWHQVITGKDWVWFQPRHWDKTTATDAESEGEEVKNMCAKHGIARNDETDPLGDIDVL